MRKNTTVVKMGKREAIIDFSSNKHQQLWGFFFCLFVWLVFFFFFFALLKFGLSGSKSRNGEMGPRQV